MIQANQTILRHRHPCSAATASRVFSTGTFAFFAMAFPAVVLTRIGRCETIFETAFLVWVSRRAVIAGLPAITVVKSGFRACSFCRFSMFLNHHLNRLAEKIDRPYGPLGESLAEAGHRSVAGSTGVFHQHHAGDAAATIPGRRHSARLESDHIMLPHLRHVDWWRGRSRWAHHCHHQQPNGGGILRSAHSLPLR